jgi:transcriptional regulator with XRE-family HTH domain
MTLKELVGSNIRRIREKQGMSMGELAKKTGRHYTAIAQFEEGHRLPGLVNAVRVAHALEVTLDKLVSVEE